MRLHRHAALLSMLCAAQASPAMVRAAEEEAGIPPLEPEDAKLRDERLAERVRRYPRAPESAKVHQHKREIARRLRQQARAAEKRARRETPATPETNDER